MGGFPLWNLAVLDIRSNAVLHMWVHLQYDIFCRAGEMTQWVGCLLYKHGDLHLIGKQAVHVGNSIAGTAEAGDVGPPWPVSLIKTASSWFTGRPISEE